MQEIKIEILKYLKVTPTTSQSSAIEEFSKFITISNEQPIFILKGYAGTGKTYLISSIVNFLESHGQICHLMAPTGRAAKIFSGYSSRDAVTIHRKIYYGNDVDSMRTRMQRNNQANSFFFVDEASMISSESQNDSNGSMYNVLDDLMSYVFSNDNCKLILIGDTAQLPPIGFPEPNALNSDYLKQYSNCIFTATLSDIVRQENSSQIIENATELRELINNLSTGYPKIKVGDKKGEVISIKGDELIESLTKSFDTIGLEDTIVITRSNKRSIAYNQGIRNSILFKEEELTTGDLLMVTKNNYYWTKTLKELPFIANGDLIKVVRVKKHEDLYGFRFVNAIVSLVDNPEVELELKIILDSILSESPSLSPKQYAELESNVLQDYDDVTSASGKRKKLIENPFYNALQVKYGYAITCHKAQGGQWESVFIDQGYVPEEQINTEYYKWLYTAFTRAKKQVVLVNFSDEMIIK